VYVCVCGGGHFHVAQDKKNHAMEPLQDEISW